MKKVHETSINPVVQLFRSYENVFFKCKQGSAENAYLGLTKGYQVVDSVVPPANMTTATALMKRSYFAKLIRISVEKK